VITEPIDTKIPTAKTAGTASAEALASRNSYCDRNDITIANMNNGADAQNASSAYPIALYELLCLRIAVDALQSYSVHREQGQQHAKDVAHRFVEAMTDMQLPIIVNHRHGEHCENVQHDHKRVRCESGVQHHILSYYLALAVQPAWQQISMTEISPTNYCTCPFTRQGKTRSGNLEAENDRL
jgi:hypothetical protein